MLLCRQGIMLGGANRANPVPFPPSRHPAPPITARNRPYLRARDNVIRLLITFHEATLPAVAVFATPQRSSERLSRLSATSFGDAQLRSHLADSREITDAASQLRLGLPCGSETSSRRPRALPAARHCGGVRWCTDMRHTVKKVYAASLWPGGVNRPGCGCLRRVR